QFDLLARNPQVPPEVDQVFRRSVAFKPEERYATAGELAAALAEATGVAPPAQLKAASVPPPVAPRAPTPIAAQPVAPRAATPIALAPVPSLVAPRAQTPTAPQNPVPRAPTPAAGPAPVAARAATPGVQIPVKAGDVSVRERTEEIGEEAIE